MAPLVVVGAISDTTETILPSLLPDESVCRWCNCCMFNDMSITGEIKVRSLPALSALFYLSIAAHVLTCALNTPASLMHIAACITGSYIHLLTLSK